MASYSASYLQLAPVPIPSTSIHVFNVVMFLLSAFGILNGTYILYVSAKLGQSVSIWIYSMLISLLLLSTTSCVNALVVLVNYGWKLGATQCILSCFCFTLTSGLFFFGLIGRALELYMVFVNDIRSRRTHFLMVCSVWVVSTLMVASPYASPNSLEMFFLPAGYFQCEYAVYTRKTLPLALGCVVVFNVTFGLPSIAIAYYRMHQMVTVPGKPHQSSKATTELFKHSLIYVIFSIFAFVPVQVNVLYEMVFAEPPPLELHMVSMICLYSFSSFSPWLMAATCRPLGNALGSQAIAIKDQVCSQVGIVLKNPTNTTNETASEIALYLPTVAIKDGASKASRIGSLSHPIPISEKSFE